MASMNDIEARLEGLLEQYPADVGATVRALRDLVREVLPDGEELVDPADHLLGYAFRDPATGKRAWDILAVAPHRGHVNVQFGNGVELPDPGGLLTGTGKRARHATCRRPEDTHRTELRELILAQARLRGVLPSGEDGR